MPALMMSHGSIRAGDGRTSVTIPESSGESPQGEASDLLWRVGDARPGAVGSALGGAGSAIDCAGQLVCLQICADRTRQICRAWTEPIAPQGIG